MVRKIIGVTLLILLASRGLAGAQPLGIHAAAGPTLRDAGYSIAAGVDFSPAPYLAVVFNVERTYIASQVRNDGNVISRSRGARMTLGTAELRVRPFGHKRVGPYGLIGMGIGVARPNEDALYPGEGTTGRVRSVFAGGGLHAPIRERLSAFAEFRMMLVAEEHGEGLLGAGPLRAGLAWRF